MSLALFRGGQRLWRTLPALVLLAGLCVVGWECQAGIAHQETKNTVEVPAELNALMQQAAEAANGRKPDAFADLTADGNASPSFNWVKSARQHWSVDALTVPTAQANAAPAYLVVFHTWHSCEADGDHVYRSALTPQGWKLGAEILETDPNGFRIRHHELNAALDIPNHAASFTDQIRVERLGGNVPPYALLRISEDFKVEAITQDKPDGAPVSFQQAGGLLAVTPPSGKTFTLALKYAGSVNHRGSDYIHPNEATLDSYWYPHIARIPTTATVTVTTPQGWAALAPGEVTQETHREDGSTQITFRNDVPISFYTLDVGKYTIYNRPYKGKTLYCYFLTPDQTLADRCLDTLQHTMDFYQARFCPFPFTRYAVVQTQGPFGGALEAYSFATFGPRTLPGFIPHEFSHSWWGGLLPCTYTHSMWNEAFADYSDGLFHRIGEASAQVAKHPVTKPDRQPRNFVRYERAFKSVPLGNAFNTEDGAQSEVGYGKGALVLRVLEEELGQDMMLRCVHAFAAQDARQFPVEWAQFESVVNQVTKKNYHWFFTQWLERTGLPVVTLSNVTARKGADGAFQMEGDIVQEGTPYRLTLPVLIELRDNSFVSRTVEISEASTHFRWTTKSAPSRLTLDPSNLLPLAPPSHSDTDWITVEFPAEHAEALPLHMGAVCAQENASETQLAFLQRVAKIVNQRDRKAFGALQASETWNETNWVDATSALPPRDPANSRPWRVLPLALPNGTGQTLAVLTRYHPCESRGDHVYALMQQGGQWKLGPEYREDDSEGIRIRSHQARVVLEPAQGRLSVEDTMTLEAEPHSQEPLSHVCLLRLEDGYAVQSIRSGGKDVRFVQAGGIIALDKSNLAELSSTPPASVQVQIHYAGLVAQSGEDFLTPQETALSGYWLPQIARLPVTSDVTLVVPRGWTAFTQGVLTAKTSNTGAKTTAFTYHNTLPVSFPSLTAGPYRILSGAPAHSDPFRVSVAYLHPMDKGLAQSALQTAQSALHFYHTHFSPFPFPSYTVVISDRYSMALEGYSMTTVAHSYVPNVLPHEIAHTWWGGILPATYLHDLWNESFAEYSDGLYERVTKNKDGMHLKETEEVLQSGVLNNAQSDSLRNASDALDLEQGLIGYYKGSLVLENLENMLGQKTMLACLRDFLNKRHAGKPVVWENFVQAVTETAGSQWVGFFSVWLPSTQTPNLHLENVRVEPGEEANTRLVKADIVQQKFSSLWLNVPVELHTRDGVKQTATVTLKSGSAPVQFTLPLGAKPDTLEIDPQDTLLRVYQPDVPEPTLGEMRAKTKILRVIYGTGGSAEEQTAMHDAATAATKLFPGAKVTLQTDKNSVSDPRPFAGSILLIGRPDTNAIIQLMAGLLPIHFTREHAFVLNDKTFDAPDTQALALISAPSGPNQLRPILIFSGLSAAALRQIDTLAHLPDTQSTCLLNSKGTVLASHDAQPHGSTLYSFERH